MEAEAQAACYKPSLFGGLEEESGTVTVHRVKSYSAETGIVYQYSFQNSRRARRTLFTPGTEYLFEVSSDRKTSFLVPVFVRDDALRAWERQHGRSLSSAEQYAAAKMRLFRAFDSGESLESTRGEIVVDAGNIEELLVPLDIG